MTTTEHVDLVCDCGSAYCMFCAGGLWACDVCDSFEGATTTDCPGRRMTEDERDAVYLGELDYRADGGWVAASSPHTPNGRT